MLKAHRIRLDAKMLALPFLIYVVTIEDSVSWLAFRWFDSWLFEGPFFPGPCIYEEDNPVVFSLKWAHWIWVDSETLTLPFLLHASSLSLTCLQEYNFFRADRFLYGDGVDDSVDQSFHGGSDGIDCIIIQPFLLLFDFFSSSDFKVFASDHNETPPSVCVSNGLGSSPVAFSVVLGWLLYLRRRKIAIWDCYGQLSLEWNTQINMWYFH